MEMLTKELVVTLVDRPGTLFKAVEAIAKAGVNIEGYCAFATTDKEGVLHLIANNPAGARRALETAGFKIKEERDVLVIDAQNKPGFLANTLKPIADEEINVSVTYSLVGDRIAISAPDVTKLREAVRKAARSATPA